MENKDKLDQNLEDLHALDSNLAEYMLLFTDALRDFEIESFFEDPSRVSFVYPDLEDDQSELLNMIQQIKSNADDTEFQELKRIIKNIFDTTEKTPVTRWALTPIMEYLDLPTDLNIKENIVRFHMPNILWSHKDEEAFYRACKLTKDTSIGAGSHEAWKDKHGQIFAIGCHSKKLWAKNIIKKMLKAGLPLERIQEACKKERIAFRIISK